MRAETFNTVNPLASSGREGADMNSRHCLLARVVFLTLAVSRPARLILILKAGCVCPPSTPKRNLGLSHTRGPVKQHRKSQLETGHMHGPNSRHQSQVKQTGLTGGNIGALADQAVGS